MKKIICTLGSLALAGSPLFAFACGSGGDSYSNWFDHATASGEVAFGVMIACLGTMVFALALAVHLLRRDKKKRKK